MLMMLMETMMLMALMMITMMLMLLMTMLLVMMMMMMMVMMMITIPARIYLPTLPIQAQLSPTLANWYTLYLGTIFSFVFEEFSQLIHISDPNPCKNIQTDILGIVFQNTDICVPWSEITFFNMANVGSISRLNLRPVLPNRLLTSRSPKSVNTNHPRVGKFWYVKSVNKNYPRTEIFSNMNSVNTIPPRIENVWYVKSVNTNHPLPRAENVWSNKSVISWDTFPGIEFQSSCFQHFISSWFFSPLFSYFLFFLFPIQSNWVDFKLLISS